MQRVLWFVVIALLAGCGSKEESKPLKEVSHLVKPTTVSNKLYYSGTIMPLENIDIAAAASGVVEQVNFVYGQEVKKGQPLFQITSEELGKEYRTSLTEYLESKEKLETAQRKFESSAELWRLGIISDESYKADKSAYDSQHISCLRALFNLKQALKRCNVSFESVKQLKLSDFSAVEKALRANSNRLTVVANSSGVALIPSKEASGSGNQKKIATGSEIKTGQALLAIGNMHGVSLEIMVNEVELSKIHIGDKVIISGTAFSPIQLTGQVSSIDQQASSQNDGGRIPVFKAKIVVPELSLAEQQIVKVGMSAKVELTTAPETALTVPINAIGKNADSTFVMKRSLGAWHRVPVKTGVAGAMDIVVTEGLTKGDQIRQELKS